MNLHLRARVENGKLVQHEILCPNCGSPAMKVYPTSARGETHPALVCSEKGCPLADFDDDAQMEKVLEELWNGAEPYLLHASRKKRNQ